VDHLQKGRNRGFCLTNFFAFPVGWLWFGGFEFDGLAFHKEKGLRLHRFIENAQGVLPVFVSGNPDEFARDS
jgi:hypothetical protein